MFTIIKTAISQTDFFKTEVIPRENKPNEDKVADSIQQSTVSEQSSQSEVANPKHLI